MLISKIKKILKKYRLYKKRKRDLPIVYYICSWCNFEMIINSEYCPKCGLNITGQKKNNYTGKG